MVLGLGIVGAGFMGKIYCWVLWVPFMQINAMISMCQRNTWTFNLPKWFKNVNATTIAQIKPMQKVLKYYIYFGAVLTTIGIGTFIIDFSHDNNVNWTKIFVISYFPSIGVFVLGIALMWSLNAEKKKPLNLSVGEQVGVSNALNAGFHV
jgi:hypothetical protein